MLSTPGFETQRKQRPRWWPWVGLGVAVLGLIVGQFYTLLLSTGGNDHTGSAARVAAEKLDRNFPFGTVDIVVAVQTASAAEATSVSAEINNAFASCPHGQVRVLDGARLPAELGFAQIDRGSNALLIDLPTDTTIALSCYRWASDVLVSDHVDPASLTMLGELASTQTVIEQSERDVRIAEFLTLPLVAAIVALVLRDRRSIGFLLLTAGVSVGLALGGLILTSRVMEISVYAGNVCSVLGLAFGLDYGILALLGTTGASRFDWRRASGVSAALVGAVVGSLAFIDIPIIRSFGVAGALSAVAGYGAVRIAAVVYSPANDRRGDVHLPRLPPRYAWARIVGIGAVLTVCAVALVFVSRASFHLPDLQDLGADSHEQAAADQVHRFAPQLPLNTLDIIVPPGADTAPLATDLQRLNGSGVVLAGDRLYVGGESKTIVGLPLLFSSPIGQRVVVAIPGTTFSTESADAARSIRAWANDHGYQVTGAALRLPENLDHLRSRLPFLVLIASLCLVAVMARVYRAGALAYRLYGGVLVMTVVSIGFASLVVVSSRHGLPLLMPMKGIDLVSSLLAFALLIGLAVDYEVLFFETLDEESRRPTGRDPAAVLDRSLTRSRPAMVLSGVALSVVFGGLAFTTVGFLQIMGIVIVFGIIVDLALLRGWLLPRLLAAGDFAALRRFIARRSVDPDVDESDRVTDVDVRAAVVTADRPPTPDGLPTKLRTETHR